MAVLLKDTQLAYALIQSPVLKNRKVALLPDNEGGCIKLIARIEIRVVLWPRLPKLLSDHQIVLGGGPVVYITGKLTIKEQSFKKVNWHGSFVCLHIFFSKCYVLQGLFKCFVQEKVNYVRCV